MVHLTLRSLDFVRTDVDDAGTATVSFRPRRPLGYLAGQHGLWFVPGGGMKPFTVASAPQEELIMLATSLASGSRFKTALGHLPPGGMVRLLGPFGSFTVDDLTGPVVMLAQGMGVTPFRAMLRQTVLTGTGPRSTLVHVGRSHPLRAQTEAAADVAHYPTSRDAFTRVVDIVALEQPGAAYLVSGASAFVASTTALLRSGGIPAARIRRDTFYGYTAPAADQTAAPAPEDPRLGPAVGAPAAR